MSSNSDSDAERGNNGTAVESDSDFMLDGYWMGYSEEEEDEEEDTEAEDDDDEEKVVEEKEKEGEDEEDGVEKTADLSHLVATATCIKSFTTKQQSLQVEKSESAELQEYKLPTGQEVSTTRTNFPNTQHNDQTGQIIHYNVCQNIHLQQFGDVNVKGTKNLNIGGTQNIATKSRPLVEEEGKPLTLTQKIRKRTVSKMESWTKGMTKTSALNTVMEMLHRGQRWVTIRGSPGEGKTTVGYMALEQLHGEGRQVFVVISPEELLEVVMSCHQSVIMFDDIFGGLQFDEDEWRKWKPAFIQVVVDLLEHRSHETEMNALQQTTVIFVGRDYVLRSASRYMGRFSDILMHKKYAVEMSHSTPRNIKEKINILKAIVKDSGTDIDMDTIFRVCEINTQHGFPHVCRLFVTQYKADRATFPEIFFKNPLNFLKQTILNFMENKIKLKLFKEMIKRDGKITDHDLERFEDSDDMIQTANDLLETYLKREDQFILFDHASIHDCVALILCQRCRLFVIENCSLPFIHQRLRLQLSTESQNVGPSDYSGDVVYIPNTYAEDLAKRFAVEVIKMNLFQVLSHQAFEDEMFVRIFMQHVTFSLSELFQLKDRMSFESFLSLITSSRSHYLLKCISKEAHLTQDHIITVLFGICKHAASDALSYLEKNQGKLDINVRNKDGQTALMIAAGTRDDQFVQKIISLGSDLNAKDKEDKTVFHYMCENGLSFGVQQMIKGGTKCDEKDKWGFSGLVYACRSEHLDIIQFLLESGAKPDLKSIKIVCRQGNLDAIKILMKKMEQGVEDSPQTFITLARTLIYKCIVHKNALLTDEAYANQVMSDKDHLHVFEALEQNTTLYQGIMYTALSVPSEEGFKECIDMLLKVGANVNLKFTNNYTQLQLATIRGSLECVEFLLKAGADVNACSEDGNAPLYEAADRGFSKCVQLLLKAGAQVNAQNKDGHTAFSGAVAHSFEDCIDLLLKAVADVNLKPKVGNTPLYNMVMKGDVQGVQQLLKAGADVNAVVKDGLIPLHAAADMGFGKCLELLLNYTECAKPEKEIIYSRTGFTDEDSPFGTNISLMKRTSYVNVKCNNGYTPLLKAVIKESEECIYLLLEAGADVNLQDEYGNTPLHKASQSGSKGFIELLLNTGAFVNVQSIDGSTPLHGASLWGCQECVKMLLKAGAHVNVRNIDCATPICEAAKAGSAECVELLLFAGADVIVQNINGSTPLHEAAKLGSKECVELLLYAGAYVNVQNVDDSTPLYEAAKIGSKECVKLLLDAGADINMQNKDGSTPLHKAAQVGSKDCYKLLLQAVADET